MEIKEEDSMDTDSDYDEQVKKGEKKGEEKSHGWNRKSVNEMRQKLPNECWLN